MKDEYNKGTPYSVGGDELIHPDGKPESVDAQENPGSEAELGDDKSGEVDTQTALGAEAELKVGTTTLSEDSDGSEQDVVTADGEVTSPPAAEPPDSEGLPAVLVACESLAARLAKVEELLEGHWRAETAKSKAAHDQLYDEMQGYKQNFLVAAQRPLLADLMLHYDTIVSLRQDWEQVEEIDLAVLRDNLRSLEVEAEEVLARAGVERMGVTPDKLDVRLQQAMRTIPTEIAEEDLRVVERLKAGFAIDGRPLRKEQVVILKHRRPTPTVEETRTNSEAPAEEKEG